MLFRGDAQQLIGLNETADRIWNGLASGRSPRAVAASLHRAGPGLATAEAYVADALGSWLRSGLVAPAEIADAPLGDESMLRRLTLDGCPFTIRLASAQLAGACDEVFGQFATTAPPCADGVPRATAIEVAELAGWAFVTCDGELLGGQPFNEVLPRLKAAITERLIASPREGFYAHGALVERAGRRLLLLGEPGAGKTTLSMALRAGGWRYLADDLVRIDTEGRVSGVPFSPAIKAGAWTLLAKLMPELSTTPIHLRTDGKLVRYGHVARGPPTRACSIDDVILISRGEAQARLEPVSAVVVLQTFLGGAFSASGRLDADTFARLGAMLDAATSHRLHYSSLPQALALIDEAVNVTAG